MNKSQRIHLNTGDTENIDNPKYFTVRLEQDVETLEFMSMTLRTKDVYQNFNADYGVLVGRVIANGGIGVENAKISIFIPITDEDAENPNIYKIYPYTSPRDKNNEGKRYNLLPRVSKRDPETDEIRPKQAFGSFPTKEEIVTNETFLEVYKKYYKYTTTTNSAGDYMIFGVPVGTQTVHMSCDITDIGKYSMNPASMVVNLGYPEAQFTDRNTRIKPSDDLGDLPNIETQEISVDVRPFWGDKDTFEIGITRQDFRIRATLSNSFVVFGSAFTDSDRTMRGTEDDQDPNVKEIRDFFVCYPQDSRHATSLSTKRIGTIKETIYYYPASITDAQISGADPEEDMLILDKSRYSVYTRNGDFAFIIDCNRNKVITDDEGNEVPVDDDNPNGVFTEFRGFITLEYELNELPIIATSGIEEKSDGTVKEKDRTQPLRLKFKFPQHAAKGKSFDYNNDGDADAWRKQHMKFEAQKFYSFSRFHATIANKESTDNDQFDLKETLSSTKGGFFKKDTINYTKASDLTYGVPSKTMGDIEFNVGVIQTSDSGDFNNSDYGMIYNNSSSDSQRFGANWLNFSIYFPQIGYMLTAASQVKDVRVADYLATQWEDKETRNAYFVFDNTMPIAAGQVNTKWYGRSDLHWTDIIEVPLADIKEFRTKNKGFKLLSSGFEGSDYRNGTFTPPYTTWKQTWSDPCPYEGGGDNGTPGGTDNYFYFYKGFDTSDCIDWLYDLGLVT